jgi:hypothetical protein
VKVSFGTVEKKLSRCGKAMPSDKREVSFLRRKKENSHVAKRPLGSDANQSRLLISDNTAFAI